MTRTELRRGLGRALIASLTIAAMTASFALVNGDFGNTDARVIATSLGFAIYSAFAAAGASMRLRARDPRQLLLGNATVVAAAASFALLLLPVWIDAPGEALWKAWGILSLVTIASSHASLVTAARRTSDTDAVRALATASVVLGVLDALGAVAAILKLLHVDEGTAQVYGVLVIALLLTTVLPPIIRKLSGLPAETAVEVGPARGGLAEFAHEALSSADRIESLANGSAQIALECQRLRGLAKYHLR